MTEESLVITKMSEPIHVTITRSAKGRYQWEISIHGATADETLETGIRIDKQLLLEYGDQASGENGDKKE
jgi:hypothetical protein